MTNWVVNIFSEPYPGLFDAPASYIDAWRRYVDPEMAVTPASDREDWLEQAARLEAGMRLLDDPIIRVYDHEPAHTASGEPVETDALCGLPHYGCVPNAYAVVPDYLYETGNANQYYKSPVIRSLFLRRHTTLTAVDSQAVREAVRNMALWGCDVLVKYVRRQKVLPNVRIERDKADSFDASLWLDWEEARFAGDPDSVLVQQLVDMRREYRMFIIDGRPVCGAGCVEYCTPINNEDVFDPKMEEHRNDGHVIRDKRTVNAYRDFAGQAADMIRTEGIIHGPYVMDLATVDGHPCIVELNCMNNAGLYALDMDALLTATNAHPESFIPDTARPSAAGKP